MFVDMLMLKNGDSHLLDSAQEEWVKHNLTFDKVKDIYEALSAIQKKHFLFIILEANDQNKDFILNVITLLRNIVSTPIAVVSDEFIDVPTKVNMLSNGADQICSQPMTLEEAATLISGQIRRFTEFSRNTNPSAAIYSHGILINYDYHKAYIYGAEIDLLRKEFDILSFLIKNKGKVMTYEHIFREVWGEDYTYSSKEILWSQIRRIRSKIQISPDLPDFIRTVQGVGYSFDPQYGISHIHNPNR